MEREVIKALVSWKTAPDRLPLLIRGARQVGKTHAALAFGWRYYEDMLTINFEQQREYIPCFKTLYPEKILQLIYAVGGKTIIPGKTLLFLDEIQECPNAIMALRYFYEQMPEQHIIGAGSLLEFTLRNVDFKMPVGRIQSCYLKPMSFTEFLMAANKKSLVEYLISVNLHDSIDTAVHDQLIVHLKEYLTLGGMPAVLRTYFTTGDLAQCKTRQHVIMDNYRQDFGKYAKHTDIKYLQRLLDKAPGMVSHHFKYRDIDPDVHSRNIKHALYELIDAGILYKNHATSASGLPLISTMNEEKFKLFFLDIGLLNSSMGITASSLLSEDILLLNRGALAEQFVAQELLTLGNAFEKNVLFYWERAEKTSTAEVDFITTIDSTIVPIEVKAGSSGHLRSLHVFMALKKLPVAVRINSDLPSIVDINISTSVNAAANYKLISLPFYLLGQVNRLLRS